MNSTKIIGTRIKKIAGSKLAKVFGLTTVSTLVKIITSFISVKVVAVIIGPAGIALLGQLNNFSAMIMTLATGGIGSGVVKYTSEYKNQQSKLRLYLSTALMLTLVFSGLCGVVLILFAGFFSKLILLNIQYTFVFRIFGFTIVLYALNNLLIAFLNGFQEYKKFVLVAISTSIAGLVISVLLVWFFNIEGALVSAVTFQSVVFFVTVFFVLKSSWFTKKNLSLRFSKPVAKKYFTYSLMALTSAATVPVGQLIIRGHIISRLSIESGGWWEAMNRLSGLSLLLITSSFGVYYLPRFSELIDKKALANEIKTAFKIIVPLLLVMFSAMFILREFIITLIFSKAFLPIKQLFIWQICGDFFKICSWLLAYVLVAKARIKIFIATEIFFSVSFVALAFLLLHNGILGVVQAYLINYFFYFLFMAFWLIRYLKEDKKY